MIHEVARIADAFRPWGVRLSMSVPIDAPQVLGGLDTFDPGDPKVAAWWRAKFDEVYAAIPDFGGIEVKADSEGQPGPSKYGRTPVDAANMFAAALQPHGGIVVYRAFVYNHHLDWNDIKADRARSAYDIFHPLDGKFADNVIVQIKNGPIDFQVREPVSPLFAGLHETNEAIELQITQEYMGQARHLVFLPTQWKEALDFDLHAENRATPVKEIIDGKTFHRPLGGYVGVADVGLDANWMGHPMSMANLYGFGRLAWNPNATATSIAEDWTRLTFSNDPKVVSTVSRMLLTSWPVYEHYTGPLGLQTLTNITGPHYGPAPQSQEHNGWGQWIRADHDGVGHGPDCLDRHRLHRPVPARRRRDVHLAEDLSGRPAALHASPAVHVSPAHRQNRDPDDLRRSLSRCEGSGRLRHAMEDRSTASSIRSATTRFWAFSNTRPAMPSCGATPINRWFEKMSGIPDNQHRIDHDPNRITASQMQLQGYTPIDATIWETATSGKAYACEDRTSCTASAKLNRPAGWYSVAVQYFDYRRGASAFALQLNQQTIATWTADNTLPGEAPNGDTSTRFTLYGVPLRPGDTLTIEARPNDGEPAPIDYIEITPEPAPQNASAH